MGQTVAQKIIARAAKLDTVDVGQYVTVSPDYTVMQELYLWKGIEALERFGLTAVANPEKLVAVVDHTPQAATGTVYQSRHARMKSFASDAGLSNFFGVGRGGLRHLVMVEQGFARPGLLIFSDEGNIASIGAVGALNVQVSWEVIASMITDRSWLRVPASAMFVLQGELAPGVWIRDLVQTISHEFAATDTLAQKCVEFVGPGIAGLSLDSRQGLLAGMYHSGADTAVMEVDDVALRYVRSRARDRAYETFTADSDADYPVARTYDLSQLEPQVTAPPRHENVVPVSAVAGMPVDHATVGSCASNRLDDIRAAASILKGRSVHPRVTMYVTPGSQEIFAAAAKEGLFEILAGAGANVLSPGCTTCWGYMGGLSAGETAISTNQENYSGRMGSRDASIYLSSPYVVAAAAVAGQVVDPREFLL